MSSVINTLTLIVAPTTKVSAKVCQNRHLMITEFAEILKHRKSTATLGKSLNLIFFQTSTEFLFNSKCRGGQLIDCESDTCLSEENVVNFVNLEAANLGWKATNYSEFWGRKLKDGLIYRLGTFEPRVRVKSMSRLSNKLETLPREFNSLDQWTGLISDIRDQGWCG